MARALGAEAQQVEFEDDSGAVLKAVGRQLKSWRERAGLTQGELGAAIGYGDEQVASVERGRRVPRPEYLDKADEALDAGGIIAAMKVDVAEARYPKKVRDLAKLESEAVELGAYENHNVHGLLQTEDCTRALFQMRRPVLAEDVIERGVAARLARQSILTQQPTPILSFVQEEVTLLRPIGGRMVWRAQLEHLLEVGRLRHVEIQVMPTEREDHAGMAGPLQLLKLRNGSTVGHVEVQRFTRLASAPNEVQPLETQYGIIRAQALTPRESLKFIEKALGDS
ncbi:helix-turn-helix domain-containing protein [Streptomyces montanisoli]|uniref:Helix-turn-helix transcriptional regulator n=1 Tax=Streptomyces montanisoli TaxID=2798581 RepID=A0A940MBW1_9ACTN|nr:helix-turn-helix transcriptional regulator [Streptomyces montanisoli]MBP0457571.1 helix-turn-helix transcriptional regulator [Streptomyces montanisoli]